MLSISQLEGRSNSRTLSHRQELARIESRLHQQRYQTRGARGSHRGRGYGRGGRGGFGRGRFSQTQDTAYPQVLL